MYTIKLCMHQDTYGICKDLVMVQRPNMNCKLLLCSIAVVWCMCLWWQFICSRGSDIGTHMHKPKQKKKQNKNKKTKKQTKTKQTKTNKQTNKQTLERGLAQ